MTTNKLAIIGGSGLYDVEEFKERELLDLQTPWGKPSDQILNCLLYTSPSPRDATLARMPSSA